MTVGDFLDGLQHAGYWDEECDECGVTFQDPECRGICDECAEMRCPGCLAPPGAGYTAGCHHPEGCGYYKSAMGALSNRLPEEPF